jgi:hypothetical protein
VAVGSFTTMGSSWNSLSADEKNKSIIFRRDLTATFQDGSKSKLLYYGLTRPYISAINSYNISLFNVASQSDVDTKYGSGYITCKGPISPLYLSLKPNGANYETVLPITDTMYVTCDSFSKVMTLEQTFILVREK